MESCRAELHVRAGEHLLKRYSALLERHACRLGLAGGATAPTAIRLTAEPHETCVLPLLAAGDNRLLAKVLLALAAICGEARLLAAEARSELVPALQLYGADDDDDEEAEGSGELQLARLLPTLRRLLAFSERCRRVAANLLQQLAALHAPARSRLVTAGFHLQILFEHLGDLLAALALLDGVVAHHAVLHDHFTRYKQLLRHARPDPHSFGLDAQRVSLLDRLLSDLETHVLSSRMLHDTLTQPFSGSPEARAVLECREFIAEFLLTVGNMLLQLETNGGPELDAPVLVAVAALVALHARLAGHADARTVRQLWAIHRRRPPLVQAGHVWSLDAFLTAHLAGWEQLVERKARDAAAAGVADALSTVVQALPRVVREQTQQVAAWSVVVASRRDYDPAHVSVAGIVESEALLRRGLALADQLGDGARHLLDLHAHTARPLPAATALLVCRQVELLKALEETVNGSSAWVRLTARCAAQHAQYRVLRLVAAVRSRVVADRRLADGRLDLVSALESAERAVAGPATRQRHLVARLALSLCTQPGVFRDGELAELVEQLRRLQLTSGLPERLRDATCCAFLYWSRSLLPAYLRDVAARPDDPRRLQLMVAALRDPARLLRRCRHRPPQQLLLQYEAELVETVAAALLRPLCADVETELRLDVHAHLQLDDRNPFKVGLRDRRRLLAAPPLPLLSRRVSVRRVVERHLERTFYNLTAVAQHDWRTYAEMRNLARDKYGLTPVEPHLPGQTLDQGLDVLEVMRNIHVFVAHYAYNLTNQFFVERQSNNKHLNTIGIQHVANSIRTHGAGIVATTVNFTYQFLRRKLNVLSQFLFDEQISSRLSADAGRDSRYQLARAERFRRAIRALGVGGDGASCLDRCRQLVTQVGGALGFVRLVRSGGLQCASGALQFVADADGAVGRLSDSAQLGDATQRAAAALDACLSELTVGGDRNTAYFRLLLQALAPALRDTRNTHLRAFHLLVPPLCLAHVHHMLAAKERLAKNARSGALFTDDGFAMGVAFLLRLLDLNGAFDALYWFDEVAKHHADELAAAEGQSSATGRDDNLQQAIALTKRRLVLSRREFDLLFYNLSAARVFFRSAPEECAETGAD